MKNKSVKQASHTPGPLSFDGCGINGGDKYRERIATFVKLRGADAKHYGPMFEAAPELLEALKQLANISTAKKGSVAYGIVSDAWAVISKATGRE